MHHVTSRGRVPVAVLAAASAVLLGACSSGSTQSGGGGSPTTTSAPAATATTSTAGGGGSGATTTTFDEATNARPDVSASPVCTRDAAGAWSWRGTVTNKSGATHSYTITVDFTDAAATVEDTKVVTVRALGPRRTARWTVTGARGRTAVTCVIRSARIS